MSNCEYFEICGLEDAADPKAHRCILHSESRDKNVELFDVALENHRRKHEYRCKKFVFPRDVDFHGVIFNIDADFDGAKFYGSANFERASFARNASFEWSTFEKSVYFVRARFNGVVWFRQAQFHKEAAFIGTAFVLKTCFNGVKFSEDADFESAEFKDDVSFHSTEFLQDATFEHTTFAGRVTFSGYLHTPVRDGQILNLANVVWKPDLVHFRDTNLSRCSFRNTDCRKIELTNVRWPSVSGRKVVYDEIALVNMPGQKGWAHIEKLYRELKQNYEDRKDYERAGEFHYGEKEMRRLNSETRFGLRAILFMYRALSGYGERVWRPLVWLVVLAVGGAGLYIELGLAPESRDAVSSDAVLCWPAFPEVLRYSLETMLVQKPMDLEPTTEAGRWFRVFQSVFGPVVLGLFVLALRQRLRR